VPGLIEKFACRLYTYFMWMYEYIQCMTAVLSRKQIV